ncbi:uncharacterized protein LOC143017982 [Oratosquilla oratoria]|uniref:uncharacterized protein LOC143017982 n=1 Tax=Oratosquilla oratoria TaxID=337810 RepID=UPI003F76C235
MEKIAKASIVQHLTDNALLNDQQHGFRNKRSCLTNMLCYLNNMVNAVDCNQCVDVNYLDCEEVFDRIPHVRLLVKLGALRVESNVLDWVRSFLTDRFHQPLEKRRMRGNMIETFKLLQGYKDVSYTRFFQLNRNNL